MFIHLFQIILYFMYICQSFSWLTFLLKFDKYRDISSSGSDIFLQFFGEISGMLTRQFQIILNFLYVCQSVSWLTSLLKLYKYRDNFSSGRDIFLKFLRDLLGTLYNSSTCFWIFLVAFLECLYTRSKLFRISCMPVSLLVGLLSYWS